MYDCVPLFVPSNLGETKLDISIDPSYEKFAFDISELKKRCKVVDKTSHFDWYFCFIRAKNVKTAQQTVNRLSKQLEERPGHSIQSDRLYLLPLFTKVSYILSVNQSIHYEHPVIRTSYCTEEPLRPWTCKIYASNLVQLQEALFSHERNLLKKQLQVLNQKRNKIWESELT